MGFRIHRGIFQKLEADGRTYTNTFKVDTDGRIKEVDADGNVIEGYLKIGENVSSLNNDAGYLTSVPSEYLTQTEGDARYLRSLPSHNHDGVYLKEYALGGVYSVGWLSRENVIIFGTQNITFKVDNVIVATLDPQGNLRLKGDVIAFAL